MSALPSSAKIVIVGGGIVGCSVAYHLGKMGLTDVLLLERGKLTCGSTWHAAGLVGQLRTSANITQLLGYSVDLYDRLEKDTGLATGWKRNGGLRLACNPRALDRSKAAGDHRHVLRARDASPDAEGGAGTLAADAGRRRRRRGLPPDRRTGFAIGHHHVARQGRAQCGRHHQRRRERHRRRGREWSPACRHDRPRPDRLRQARDLRRPMVARDRAHGRRQRAPRLGAAPISHHRGDRRRDLEPADLTRSRPSHLLEGRGRGAW